MGAGLFEIKVPIVVSIDQLGIPAAKLYRASKENQKFCFVVLQTVRLDGPKPEEG